ncbi:MAG: hypothetical protein J0L77_05640 [Alphaproteobacteria bacterium]|nr:hypothetical protein [Alphaproteobacteria bacterium]
MSRQFKRPKTDADRFDPISAAQDFLNAARTFETTKPHNKSAPRFSTLVVRAVEANLINPAHLTTNFGIDWDKAKDGRDTGVTTEKRKDFIQKMRSRARDIVPE